MVKRITVDASVVVKWLVPQQPEETDVSQALMLLENVDAGQISLHQPPHFVAEVMGVISRICPEEAPGILRDLFNTEMCREESSGIYLTATELSIRLKHHLFDTLYHATALHIPGALYITADRRYFEKAKGLGQVALLAEFVLPQ